MQYAEIVNDFGVLLDSELSIANQCNQIVELSRSCFCQLRQQKLIKQCLTLEATKTLVHVFGSSQLGYCNSDLAGVNDQLLHRLQVIQDVTACLVTEARRYEHMTPVLQSSHWLLVLQWITYKTAVIMYMCLHDLAPPYLAAHYTVLSDVGHRHSWSTDAGGQL